MTLLPPKDWNEYIPMRWRHLTPDFYGELGISFALQDGTVVKYRIDLQSAAVLAHSLRDALIPAFSQLLTGLQNQPEADAAKFHSDKSSGISNSDTSTWSGSGVEPLSRLSNAEASE